MSAALPLRSLPLPPPRSCQAFNASSGAFLFAWGDMGIGPSQFMSAGSVATCPDGSVVIADSYNGRIQRFRADGTYVSEMKSVGQVKPRHTQRHWPEHLSAWAELVLDSCRVCIATYKHFCTRVHQPEQCIRCCRPSVVT